MRSVFEPLIRGQLLQFVQKGKFCHYQTGQAATPAILAAGT
jgi:hypothetical protein